MSKRTIEGKVICCLRDAFGEMTVADDDGIRNLYFGGGILQSSMRLDNPSALLMDYSQAMLTPLVFGSQPASVLLIGLGGGSLVNFLLQCCPDCLVDAVEISPAVIRLAHEYFHVPRREERLRVIQADGLKFVREMAASGPHYDLILLDAFDDGGPAAVLLEESFFLSCQRLMKKNGICAINLWTRPRDRYSVACEMISSVFGGNVGRLSLDESYQNAVVLACDDTSRYSDLISYRVRARQMQRKWGVNFTKFLMRICWQ